MELSICMMVKDEEKNLKRCLDSIRNLMKQINSELIIVDTGSKDKTVEIAKKYTDKVYYHEWENDFSKSRNYTLLYATGKWVLLIDADEELDEIEGIIENMKKYEIQTGVGALSFLVKDIDIDNENNYSEYISPRLFKRESGIHYQGAVHNQPIYKGDTIFIEKAILFHYGYSSGDFELRRKKFDRTYGILNKELEKNPENIYYLYQAASITRTNGMIQKSKEFIEKAYNKIIEEKLELDYIYVYKHYIKILIDFENWKRALNIVEEAISTFGEDLDLIYFKAGILNMIGEADLSEVMYESYFKELQKYKDKREIDYKNSYDSIKMESQAILDYVEILLEKKNTQKASQFIKTIFKNDKLITGLKLKVYLKNKEYREINQILIEKKLDEILIFEMFYKEIVLYDQNIETLRSINWNETITKIIEILICIEKKEIIPQDLVEFIMLKSELYNYDFMIKILGYIVENNEVGIYILKNLTVEQIRIFLLKLESVKIELNSILIQKLSEIREVSYLEELKVIIEVQSFLIYKGLDEYLSEFLENINIYISNIYILDFKRAVKDSYGIEFDEISKEKIKVLWETYNSII